jgi:branched-subunit amino acid aminotransferase/4-amino-4-deoxychorismate lyase
MKPARMPDRPLWVNGAILRGEAAMLSLFDRGARDGEGIYETLRVYGGRPFHWERHLERLVLAAAELGFPVPPAPRTLAEGIEKLLEACDLAEAVARITVTRGVPGGRPTRTGCWIEVEPLAARLWSGARRGAASAAFSRRPFEPGPLGPYKTTSRLAYRLATEEARAARVDETILVSTAGEALEGAVSNLFAVVDGCVLTPPLSCRILPGIVRAEVLRQCVALGIPAREARLDPASLLEADEVFVTNSVQEVVPLATLERRPVPARAIGDRLAAAYRAEVERALSQAAGHGPRG